MRTRHSTRVLINLEWTCHLAHYGVQLMKATKALEYVKIVAQKVSDMFQYISQNLIHCVNVIALSVCRDSSGEACNIFGTNNCTTTQCYCNFEYVGEKCGNCNWRDYYFAYNGTDGNVDPITGEGAKCQKGKIYQNMLDNLRPSSYMQNLERYFLRNLCQDIFA